MPTSNQGKIKPDMVNHPKHYTSHPSGIECIHISRYLGYNFGCAFKYIWRYSLKGEDIDDLDKAIWYIIDHKENRMSCQKKDMEIITVLMQRVTRSEPNPVISSVLSILIILDSQKQPDYLYDTVIRLIDQLKSQYITTPARSEPLDPEIDHCALDDL